MKLFLKFIAISVIYFVISNVILMFLSILFGFSEVINGLSYGSAGLICIPIAKKMDIVSMMKKISVIQAVIVVFSSIGPFMETGRPSMQSVITLPFVITAFILYSMHLKKQK